MPTGAFCGARLVFVDPRPASTVILIRESNDDGFEVLMLRRSDRLDFATGAYVFPGGVVDSSDALAAPYCAGMDDQRASAVLALSGGGIAYYVAAARECFEEAGVLFAKDDGNVSLNSGSGHLDLTLDALRDKYSHHRAALNAGTETFEQIVRANRLSLTVSDLFYVSHWVTPLGRSKRYDTRFFIAMIPSGQVPLHDDGETTGSIWISPREALKRYSHGDFPIMFPTIKNLEALERFGSCQEVMSWAEGLREIKAMRPVIVERDGVVSIVVPDD